MIMDLLGEDYKWSDPTCCNGGLSLQDGMRWSKDKREGRAPATGRRDACTSKKGTHPNLFGD